MNCLFCRDTPSPGYQCSRCGAYTPWTGNKGTQGVAENSAQILRALADLANLRSRRAASRAAREAQAALYAEQIQKHVQQPQTRGARRKLMSKP